MAKRTSYVCSVTPEQVALLRELLLTRGWDCGAAAHAFWRAALDKTTVVAYRSGKLTVQGKGTPDFVQFLLEPEILGQARFGYEEVLKERETPEMFAPHAGIDESGKGDYFGPLVVAAAYVDADMARRLLAHGVADSKTIRSTLRIMNLDEQVRQETGGRFSIVAVGPEAYNRLYGRFRNVNRLLAWGHAKALENLLDKVPDCPRAISDQFGRRDTVPAALQAKGRRIRLEQRPHAEADVAVAAASILARCEFVRRLDRLGKSVGRELPKGAGTTVDAVAAEVAANGGRDRLGTLAKLHFRTTEKALAAAAGG